MDVEKTGCRSGMMRWMVRRLGKCQAKHPADSWQVELLTHSNWPPFPSGCHMGKIRLEANFSGAGHPAGGPNTLLYTQIRDTGVQLKFIRTVNGL